MPPPELRGLGCVCNPASDTFHSSGSNRRSLVAVRASERACTHAQRQLDPRLHTPAPTRSCHSPDSAPSPPLHSPAQTPRASAAPPSDPKLNPIIRTPLHPSFPHSHSHLLLQLGPNLRSQGTGGGTLNPKTQHASINRLLFRTESSPADQICRATSSVNLFIHSIPYYAIYVRLHQHHGIYVYWNCRWWRAPSTLLCNLPLRLEEREEAESFVSESPEGLKKNPAGIS